MARINIRRIVGSLMVGVVVTVLVAWRCHRFAWMKGKEDWIKSPSWPISVPSTWPQVPDRARRIEDGSISMTVLSAQFPQTRGGTKYTIEAYESGWPRRSLARYVAYTERFSPATVVRLGPIQTGLPSPFMLQWSHVPNPKHLPIMPLWRGFLANTLFYGVLALGMLTGVPMLQRRRRARRGLCVRCAYPVAGLNICPECGRLVPVGAQSPLGSGGS